MVSGIQGMQGVPLETKEECNVASIVELYERAQGNNKSCHLPTTLWFCTNAYGNELANQKFNNSLSALTFFALKTFGIRQTGTAFDYSKNETEKALFTQALQSPSFNFNTTTPAKDSDPSTIDDTIASLFDKSTGSIRSILSISSNNMSSASSDYDVLRVCYTSSVLSMDASAAKFTVQKELQVGKHTTQYRLAGMLYSITNTQRGIGDRQYGLLAKDPARLNDNYIEISYSEKEHAFSAQSRFSLRPRFLNKFLYIYYIDMGDRVLNTAVPYDKNILAQDNIVLHELYYVKIVDGKRRGLIRQNDDGKRSFLACPKCTIIAGTLIAGVGGAAALYYRYGRGR